MSYSFAPRAPGMFPVPDILQLQASRPLLFPALICIRFPGPCLHAASFSRTLRRARPFAGGSPLLLPDALCAQVHARKRLHPRRRQAGERASRARRFEAWPAHEHGDRH
eukprot:333312-Pleurochrysis_carterae.AAC.2